MQVQAINKITGEVAEFEVSDLSSLMSAYAAAQEYEKVATSLKNQLKKVLPKYLDEFGRSEVLNGRQFKTTTVQRMTYDKAVLRQVLDEDTYDQFMKPEKTKIDKYLAENLEHLGDVSTKLRQAMIADGTPYSVTKLEKLDREY